MNELRAALDEAARSLAQGEAAIFPTDTVYGIGVSVAAAQSPLLLHELKGRDEGKPIAWLVGSADALTEYGEDVPEYAHALARAHWPGALTLVVRASAKVPRAFRSASGTIGLRMPASPVALELIRMTGVPLATTSANRAGEPAPRTLGEIDGAFAARVACVLAEDAEGEGAAEEYDAATLAETTRRDQAASPVAPAPPVPPAPSTPPASGVASTVVDCTGPSPRVLRQGAITIEEQAHD